MEEEGERAGERRRMRRKGEEEMRWTRIWVGRAEAEGIHTLQVRVGPAVS